jgi:DNA-binding transcriptional ArsR family regulator
MEQIVVVARAISNPLRLDIYRVLGERGLCLTDVARAFGLSLAGTHHHLDVLRHARMVTRRYVGRKAIYFWSRSRWSLVCERAAERRVGAEMPPESQTELVIDDAL